MPTILFLPRTVATEFPLLRLLRRAGYDVQVGIHQGAHSEPRRAPFPELILAELKHPQDVQRLQADPAMAHSSMVALISPEIEATSREWMNAGADDCLSADSDPREVLQAVQARLRRRENTSRPPQKPRMAIADPEVIAALLWRDKRLNLTQREAEALAWIAEGKSNGDIAAILGIAVRTVEKHVERIFAKLGVESRGAAMLAALEACGILQHAKGQP